ncbi:MAG TPA: GMC family oxidoreductase [Hyphomicrobiaceae bacterium]|nr:GMC family oxidoreductase [Hyphomicrobiaceae bacterium]
MQRAFERAVSALCYSFIRAHFGGRANTLASAPGPAWNSTVRFVLAQHRRMPDYLRFPFKVLTLLFVAWSGFPRLGSWRSLDAEQRGRRIERMRKSPLGPFRDLIRFYEGLTIFGFYEELAKVEAGVRPLASTRASSSGRGAEGSDPVIESEIIVIGSGPGGAITACLLAEAGREVTLVESGPFVTLEECPQFTRDEMELKYRNGGITVAMGRTKVAYVEANCVGGGSEINAGLYHRTPEGILDAWRRDFGLEGASLADMTPHFEACERDVSISYLPGAAPLASLKLHEGAAIKGWTSLEVPRWFKYGSDGLGEKQSMTRTFIPRALAAGCKLVTATRARRVARVRGRWVVDAERMLPDGRRSRHKLSCKTLFLACGAIQTPALLQASGVAPLAGRSLRMHPTVKLVARFPETINAREMGVPVHQVKEFAPRLSFGCSISGTPYLSLAMLDHPAQTREVDDRWPQMAIYYAMIAGGSGSVKRVPGHRDPLVRFSLTEKDMRDLADGTRKLAELLFAAGAEALYPTVNGVPALRSIDDLLRLADPLPQGRTSLMTIHLFSSCPMGEDQRRCVTDSYGRVHGADDLYIADASLLCTAPGVNPQGSVMAFARRNALRFLERG